MSGLAMYWWTSSFDIIMCTALYTVWYAGCALGLAPGSGEST